MLSSINNIINNNVKFTLPIARDLPNPKPGFVYRDKENITNARFLTHVTHLLGFRQTQHESPRSSNWISQV